VLTRRTRAAKTPAEDPPAELEADPAATGAESVSFTLDDVVEAWPDALGALKAPVRAAIQDAQPIALEDGVVVFGVPQRRYEAINERFRKEAEAIKEAFVPRLGVAPRFKLRRHDFDAPDAFRPDASTGDPAPAEPDDDVDLDALVDAGDAAPPDSVTRLVNDLGAEIIDERSRG